MKKDTLDYRDLMGYVAGAAIAFCLLALLYVLVHDVLLPVVHHFLIWRHGH